MALFTAIGTMLGATAAASAGAGIGAFGVGVAATGTAAAIAGGTAYSMEAMKEAKKAGQANMPQAPDISGIKSEAETIANKMAKTRQKAAARTQTITTNPLGVEGEAAVARKTLLGS